MRATAGTATEGPGRALRADHGTIVGPTGAENALRLAFTWLGGVTRTIATPGSAPSDIFVLVAPRAVSGVHGPVLRSSWSRSTSPALTACASHLSKLEAGGRMPGAPAPVACRDSRSFPEVVVLVNLDYGFKAPRRLHPPASTMESRSMGLTSGSRTTRRCRGRRACRGSGSSSDSRTAPRSGGIARSRDVAHGGVEGGPSAGSRVRSGAP